MLSLIDEGSSLQVVEPVLGTTAKESQLHFNFICPTTAEHSQVWVKNTKHPALVEVRL